MYEKIVVALDGSDGSSRALAHAKEIALQSGAEVIVVQIDERLAAKGDLPHPAEGESREKVEGQVAELEAAGINAKLQQRTISLGGAGSAIAEEAAEAGADLIVVGTRGHSSIPGLLLGSVAHRLLSVAGRPVLAIPPQS